MVKGDIIKVRNTGYYEVVVVDGDEIRHKRVMSTNRVIRRYRKTKVCNIKYCELATKNEMVKVKEKIIKDFDTLIAKVEA